MKSKNLHKFFEKFHLHIAVLILVIIVLIFAKNESKKGTSAEIFFKPSKIELKNGENGSLSIVINSHKRKIAFVRLAIKFDAQIIQLSTNLVSNPKLSNVIENTSTNDANTSGRAILVLGASPEDIQPQGVFELATFTARSITGDKSGRKISEIMIEEADSQIVDGSAKELEIIANKAKIYL